MKILGASLFVLLLLVAQAAICGYLCSKCQPIYRSLNNREAPVPSDWEIESICREATPEQSARLVDIVSSININNFAWTSYIACFESISKVPVGYVLSIINVSLLAIFSDMHYLLFIVSIILNIATHWFFLKENIYSEQKDMSYPQYKVDSNKSTDENLEMLQKELNTTASASKYRVEVLRRLFGEANTYRQIYLTGTALVALACTPLIR